MASINMNILERLQAKYCKTPFIPQLLVEFSHGGLLCVTITNFDENWYWSRRNRDFDDYNKECLLITYGFLFDDTNADHASSSKKTMTIEIGRLHEEHPIHFAVPYFLCGYKFCFCISMRNSYSKKWMEPSEECIIEVPAIWTFDNYRIGDVVEYVPEVSDDALIIDVLADNKYKISCQGSEIECDGGDILEKSVQPLTVINLTDSVEMIKMLFLRRNEPAVYAVYEAIRNNMPDNLIRECLDMCSAVLDDHPLSNVKPICHFFAYHIISFLFEPHFNYSVHCLKGNEHPTLVSQWKYQSLWKLGEQSLGSCDLCRVQFVQWDFFFSDVSVYFGDAAHYCCSCVYQIVKASKALKDVLIDILENDLSMDCIDEIVHCLVGKVICTEYVHESAKNERIRNQAQIEQSEKVIARYKAKCEKYEKQIEELNEKLINYEQNEAMKFKADLDDLREQVAAKDDEIALLKKKNNDLLMELNQSKDDSASIKEKNDGKREIKDVTDFVPNAKRRKLNSEEDGTMDTDGEIVDKSFSMIL